MFLYSVITATLLSLVSPMEAAGLSPSASSSAQPAPFVPPVRPGTTFETEFNDMTVTGWTERAFTGRYEYAAGRIEGVPRGRTVTGYWLQEASPTDCGVRRSGTQHWGRFTFTFSPDGRSFTGQ